jgi:glycosyltransferase involved in cell wall biosynthesis
MKVLALPRDPNPYQRRLYGELASLGADVRYAGELTPSRTLNLLLLPIELLVRRLAGWRILHVHWVFGFAPPWAGVVPFGRRLAQAWFVFVLGVARLLGIRVAWTAHNTLPHGRVFHDDVGARRSLVRASRLVLAHSDATLSELEEIGASPRRHEVVPHGPLGPSLDPSELREPGSGEVPRTFLFFGKVLEYKGVEELLEAVAELPESVDMELTVAGECPSGDLRRRLTELAARAGNRVWLRLEYLEDDELTRLIAETDVVVLPFRKVTTSGSALHAMAHKRPLVLPDLPALADLPVQAVVRYNGSVGGLAEAIEEIVRWTPEQLQRAGRAAADYAAQTSWSAVAEKTAGAFRSMEDEPAGASLVRSAVGRILGDHQYRGSLLLLLNTALLALFGFVFWAVAARTYDASSLGTFSAVTSSATLLGAVAALGLPNTLIRHLPATRHARELILMVLSATVALGGGGALRWPSRAGFDAPIHHRPRRRPARVARGPDVGQRGHRRRPDRPALGARGGAQEPRRQRAQGRRAAAAHGSLHERPCARLRAWHRTVHVPRGRRALATSAAHLGAARRTGGVPPLPVVLDRQLRRHGDRDPAADGHAAADRARARGQGGGLVRARAAPRQLPQLHPLHGIAGVLRGGQPSR